MSQDTKTILREENGDLVLRVNKRLVIGLLTLLLGSNAATCVATLGLSGDADHPQAQAPAAPDPPASENAASP